MTVAAKSETEAETRDPLIDPAFLDQVRSKKGKERTVEFVTMKDVVIYSSDAGERRCSVTAWRRWGKGGEVLRVGPGVEIDGIQNVVISRDLGRELNAWKNRTDCGAEDGEVIGALVEYALAHFYRGYNSGSEVNEALKAHRKRLALSKREYREKVHNEVDEQAKSWRDLMEKLGR